MGERGSECIVEMEISGGGGSVDSIRYFECRRTVLEMLSDRGYAVPPSDLTTTSLLEFRSLFGQLPKPEALGLCVSLRSNPSIKVANLYIHTYIYSTSPMLAIVICKVVSSSSTHTHVYYGFQLSSLLAFGGWVGMAKLGLGCLNSWVPNIPNVTITSFYLTIWVYVAHMRVSWYSMRLVWQPSVNSVSCVTRAKN